MASFNNFQISERGTKRKRTEKLSDAEVLQRITESSDIESLSDEETSETINESNRVDSVINSFDNSSNDSGDSTESEDEAHRLPIRPELWKTSKFSPSLITFTEYDNSDMDRRNWRPVNYFYKYFDESLMALFSDCTNRMFFSKHGNHINTSVQEMFKFFGACILMSCISYPRVKMFWNQTLKISAISEAFSMKRFFKIRANLKIVIDDSVSQETKRNNKFWKVQPLLSKIRKECQFLYRPEHVSIDEQMIPFSGSCPYKQYVPSKPNPVGIKNFVVASPDGLVLDFELYQGNETLTEANNLGLGANVVLRLSKTLKEGTKIYCDRYFTGLKLVLEMLKKNIYITGTVMKNRISKQLSKLPTDKEMKVKGRGSAATVVNSDGTVAITKWFDNKPILMVSAAHGSDKKDKCSRWSKKDKEYIEIERPEVIKEYNTNMGGVDMNDRMMSLYRMQTRTRKWTVRVIMHFLDLALANSWILYKRDQAVIKTPRKDVLQFLDFKTLVAQCLLSKEIQEDSSADEEQLPSRPAKRKRINPIPPLEARIGSSKHMPDVAKLKNPMRCRIDGCIGKSRVQCTKCKVFLCLTSDRNCFALFHGK